MDTLKVAYMPRNYEAMKKLIASSKGRFCSVTFIKKDGSRRVMNIQPAAIVKRLVGDAASDQAKRAVKTRAANNPNLYNVYSVDKHAIRSVNLATVEEIKVAGRAYRY